MSSYSGSRGGAGYGTVAERTANPIANQGAVMANAKFDVGARITIELENQEGSNGPSAYGGADNPQVWNIDPDDLLFTVLGVQGTDGSSNMHVLANLNGQGADASAYYAGSPDAAMMVREAVKNRICFVGAAYQYLSAARGDFERGIAVQMGGLKTLKMGNGQYGGDEDASNYIRPGDMLKAELPVPGRQGLLPGAGSRARKGVPPSKYTLQVARASTKSACESLLFNMRQLITVPDKWMASMGEHLMGTSSWAAASESVFRFALTAITIGVSELISARFITPTAYGVATLSTNADFAQTVAESAAPANDRAVPSAEDQAKIDEVARAYPLHIAEVFKLVNTTQYTGDALANSSPATQSILGTLRYDILRKVFHDGTSRYYEYGFNKQTMEQIGRYGRTGVVAEDTTDGAMIALQLNAPKRAISGFHTAILEDMRFMIGKATTGGSAEGSGNVHVFLGPTRY